MPIVSSGLANGGGTRFFSIGYDSALTPAFGVDLAARLMEFVDEDHIWLGRLFPGVSLGRITLTLATLTDPADAGGSWSGWGLVPLEMTLAIGDKVTGDALTLLRYLTVAETSEIFMRERQPLWFNLYNDWFGEFNEGSKGESLSRTIGVRFLAERAPDAQFIPRIGNTTFDVTNKWLQNRVNHLEDDLADIVPDEVTGCGAVFLLFLHDQLGFSLDQIIAAGGETLSDVYQQLVGDDRANAFPTLLELVDRHYPAAHGPYRPRLETVFPVPNLSHLLGPAELSWVSNGTSDEVVAVLDQAATVSTTIELVSDDPTIALVPPTTTAPIGSDLAAETVRILHQGSSFEEKTVTVAAKYAGVTTSCRIHVVRPEALQMPRLNIVIANSADPCQINAVAGSLVTFAITNIGTIRDRTTLAYKWTTSALVAGRTDGPQLSVNLGAPGTRVRVEVVVTTSLGLRSMGSYEFVTLSEREDLELRAACQFRKIKHLASIPPWDPDPVESRPSGRKGLKTLDEHFRRAEHELAEARRIVEQLAVKRTAVLR